MQKIRKRRRKKKNYPVRLFLCLFIILLIFWGFSNTVLIQKFFYPFPYQQTIEKYAEQYNVDPLLVIAVIREESRFLPTSESKKGAVGLMQLMPETAQWIAEKLGDSQYTQEELEVPEKNIQYGTWYLGSLQKEFKNNLMLVLAAYNGGRGHVQEWIKTDTINLDDLNVQDIPFQETRSYVEKVNASYQKYISLYRQHE